VERQHFHLHRDITPPYRFPGRSCAYPPALTRTKQLPYEHIIRDPCQYRRRLGSAPRRSERCPNSTRPYQRENALASMLPHAEGLLRHVAVRRQGPSKTHYRAAMAPNHNPATPASTLTHRLPRTKQRTFLTGDSPPFSSPNVRNPLADRPYAAQEPSLARTPCGAAAVLDAQQRKSSLPGRRRDRDHVERRRGLLKHASAERWHPYEFAASCRSPRLASGGRVRQTRLDPTRDSAPGKITCDVGAPRGDGASRRRPAACLPADRDQSTGSRAG